eukprot:1156896-Pelagomonas_calceolata.AAC.19
MEEKSRKEKAYQTLGSSRALERIAESASGVAPFLAWTFGDDEFCKSAGQRRTKCAELAMLPLRFRPGFAAGLLLGSCWSAL